MAVDHGGSHFIKFFGSLLRPTYMGRTNSTQLLPESA